MNWKNQNVFVTGADGFFGGWLCKRLVELGANVVALVRDEKKESSLSLHNLNNKLNKIHGDITNFNLMQRIFNEYEINFCFHLAAQALVQTANRSPISTFETNIKGTWTILEALRTSNLPNFKGLIVASTDKVYGIHEKLPYTENSELRGIFPYDASKVCADTLTRCYFKTYNLPIALTRKANIYGGADLNFSRIIPETARCLIQNEELLIRSDGTPKRDYMYVEDAVDGYLMIAENMYREDVNGQAFNLSSGVPTSVLEVVNKMIEVSKKPVTPKVLGKATGEINIQYLAHDKATKVLNWKPKHTLSEGLKKTIDWYTKYFS